jgi:hypothetical protein
LTHDEAAAWLAVRPDTATEAKVVAFSVAG